MCKALDLYDRKEFYRCLQCAICTGSCPAARVVEGYNPREFILRYILDGEQDEVLKKDILWFCTTCQACRERCPHEINVTGLLTHITNLAARRGNLPDSLREQIGLLLETGWSIQATSRADRIRKELGLKPLKRPDTSEISQILREAGLDKILDKK